MKEMDLMYALSELDDELLERDSGVKVRRFRVSRVAAIAAVVALMTVTAFAAVVGIDYWLDPKDSHSASVSLEFSFPYKEVPIRQEAYDEMAKHLNEYFEDELMRKGPSYFTTEDEYAYGYGLQCAMLPAAENLNSVKALEDYLGFDLVTSPEIDKIINDNLEENPAARMTFTLYAPIGTDAYAEYQAHGSVPLLGAQINISLSEPDKNGYKDFRIVIPLDERYMEYYPVSAYYGFGDNEQHEVREYSNGNCDFVIAKKNYTDEEGSKCVALYAEDGVCYSVYTIAWPIDAAMTSSSVVQDPAFEFCMDAEELVMPLIENIG